MTQTQWECLRVNREEVSMEVSSGRRYSVLVRGLQGYPTAKGAPFEEDSTVLNTCAPNGSIKTSTAKMNNTGKRIGKSIVMCGNHIPAKDGATVQGTSVTMLRPVCHSEHHSTEQSSPSQPGVLASCSPGPSPRQMALQTNKLQEIKENVNHNLEPGAGKQSTTQTSYRAGRRSAPQNHSWM